MSVLAGFFATCIGTGALYRVQWSVIKQLLVLCHVLYITHANLPELLEANIGSPTRAPLAAPAIPELPLPSNLPLTHVPVRKHFSAHGVPKFVLPPSPPPNYGPLTTSIHPPSSPHLSKPSMKKSSLVPPSFGLAPPRLADIAPSQHNVGTIPAGLAQPPLSPHTSNCCGPDMVLKRGSRDCHCVYPIKLDLLLLNVSSNSNWNHFLEEFASQLDLRVSQIELINFYMLGLSRLNISMDITPHTGISFSANEASVINSSLSIHKVHLDPTLVGDYKLLNLTWFMPLAPSQAPLSATSPAEASPRLPSSPTSTVTSNKGKNPSLILIVGIGAGILIIGIFAVLVICSRSSHQGKAKASIKDTVKPRTLDAVPAAQSLRHPTSTRFLAYEELKEATNNFEAASILGEGGFGRVFQGCIKRWYSCSNKEAYYNRDSSQNLLCYELVPNGSLEAWLHAPEYAMTGHLLVKSDVYSYGVVLLELLTGRKPVDMCQPSGQENLVTWARPILRDKDRLEELADPRLGGKYPKEDFVRVCTIAAACVASEANQRATMGEVVQWDVFDILLRSGPYSGLSAFDNDNVSRNAVFSEDLHEGR
ncbi:protein kinase superfamily protein [Actinidia rufa]|uniref:Protein kinase superfamily protein n=1 Tax=Actinidia rufa TaxID=165716 RepID=A0A7J0G173_9ERIC|nr:protein kinase superfamily protein [Actinidia rufa]